MRSNLQPVSMGSPRSTTLDTGAFWVTEAWFPPGTTLEPHYHERGIVAVMLDGSFSTRIAGRDLDCVASTTWTEPCEERHANYVGSAGARVLVTQPDPGRADLLESFSTLMTEVTTARDPLVVSDAMRMVAELAAPDDLTPLVLESIAVLVLARASRLAETRRQARGVPPWLLDAREIVHDCAPGSLSLDELSRWAGVTQWHLAREFRRHFHCSIGEYARALRVNRALELLRTGRMPLCEVAFETGFVDQSHMTRACKAVTGLAPSAYRLRFQSRTRSEQAKPPV